MSKPTYEELEKRVKELEKVKLKCERVEESLKKSQLLQSSIIESSTDIVILSLDNNYKYISYNSAHANSMKNLWNVDIKLGENILDCIPDKRERQKAKGNFDRTLKGERFTITDDYGNQDNRFWFKITYNPLKDSRNKIIGLSLFLIDVTDQKKAEEALRISSEKYEDIFRVIPALMAVSRLEDGKYLEVNDAFIETTGFSRSEIIGKTPNDLGIVAETDYRDRLKNELKKYGRFLNVEIAIRKKDGEIREGLLFGEIFETGGQKNLLTLWTDITERKQAEQELRESEELNEKIISESPIGISIYNKAGQCLAANDSIGNIIGASKEEVLAQNYNDIESWQKSGMLDTARRAIHENKTERHLLQVTSTFGKHLDVECYFVPFIREDTINLMYMISDISERKKAEEALQESEEKYRHIFNEAQVALFRTRISDGALLDINERYAQLVGYSNVEECKADFHPGKAWANPRERDDMVKILRKEGAVRNYETEVIGGDGRRIQIMFSAYLYPEKNCIEGSIVDITEKKKSADIQKVLYNILNASLRKDTLENLLKIIHSEVDTLMDAKNFYVTLYDKETGLYTFPYFVDEYDDILQGEQVKLGKGFTEYVRRRGEPSLLDKHTVQALLDSGEVELLGCPSVSWMGIPLLNEEGPYGVVAIQSYSNTDAYNEEDLIVLTYVSGHIAMAIERKKAEDLLKDREVRYRSLFDNMSSGCSLWKKEGEDYYLRDYNQTALDMDGLERSQIIGKKISELFSDAVETISAVEIFDRVSETGKTEHLLGNIYKINGKEVVRNNHIFRLHMGEIAVVFDDITEEEKAKKERKNLENQLIQSQKMESIGKLAGGIAHDFNNILVGVMGYAEMLKMQYPDDSTEEGRAADIIFSGAERASDLTRQLLGFARGGKYNPVPLKLNKVIKDTVRVSEKIFEKKITVKYDFDKKINTIEADENQLDQVLTNLIINAKDAMPKGGDLIFKTENIYLDEEYVKIHHYFKRGYYVKLSVSDTGIGMTQDIKESIFEPFFTTKGKGKGTGLGLSTVYGIVKNHGGLINVQSESGEGTSFTLYFPVSEKAIVDTAKISSVVKGDAAILVIDDEESVRRYMKITLEKLGYTVLLAIDGKEAVGIYKQKKEEIDLVLLDMIMPKMDGKETNLALRKINPDVKVLLASGYSQNGTATEILNEGALGFVQKPFRMDELSKAIAEALKE